MLRYEYGTLLLLLLLLLDCKDTVQTLKTVTRRDCDAKELIE